MKSTPTKITYEILRSRRKTADIVIERDGSVLVRAPEEVAGKRIEDIIDSKTLLDLQEPGGMEGSERNAGGARIPQRRGLSISGPLLPLAAGRGSRATVSIEGRAFLSATRLGGSWRDPGGSGCLPGLLYRPRPGAAHAAGSVLRSQGWRDASPDFSPRTRPSLGFLLPSPRSCLPLEMHDGPAHNHRLHCRS